MAIAVFFVGWSTGMGGSFMPNLIFSIIVGGFATLVMRLLTSYMNKKQGD